MSRDMFGITPSWGETFPMPSYPSWNPRRRFGRSSMLRNMENLWDEALREMECIQSAMDRTRTRVTSEMGMTPWQSSIESHWEGDERTPGKYLMNIPLGRHIQPEDLKIRLKEDEGFKVMSIEAKKEQKSEDGSTRVYQEYTRQFTLPHSVNPKEVKSVLDNGYLKIEAPLPQKQIQHKQPELQQQQLKEKMKEAKEVPIARVG